MTDQLAGTWRPMAWALLSFIGWVVAFAMAFFLAAAARTIGVLPGDVGGLRTDLGIVLALHAALAIGAVQVAAWLTLETWPAITVRNAVRPAAGVVLAVLVELALHEWAEARYGYYDAELIGITALLSLALIAAATASFGVSVAPARTAGAPLAALIVASAGVLVIVASNVGGLGDGVGPGGWPLAVLVGAAAAYVLASLILAAWARCHG
jgi:hypothetical protein